MKRIITLLIIVLYALVGFSQENNKSESSVPIEHSKSEADSYQAFKAKIAKPSSRASGFNQRVVKPDGTSGGINVKGDITFIGNNILSKYVGWPNYNANRPYDGYEANGQVNMQYIDIDGDPSTVSSSSDQLNLPNCSRVVYAGLYWAGIYPYENWYRSPYSRQHNPNNIKFQLPGQGYQDITADETIFDDNSTYINYKDITSLVQGLVTVATPNGHNGRYMAGNIRAIRGRQGGVGGAAGWTMVIIYENDLESSKNISVFDGYAEVDGRNDVDLTYSGFSTIPLGPVRVNLLAATLEGDRSIPGDRFRIRDRFGNFISQTTGSNNLTNNFFNGSMTRYNNFVTSRVPDGENTLGFDVDLYELNNGGNSVIENNQSSIDVQFTTGGDVYWPFLNALAVEIIEPKVQLIKTIEDASGNDIQGTPVGLGNELFYNISFQNVGTDHARNTIITDRLPKNVDLLTTTAPNGSVAPDGTRFDIDLPPGVSITAYDPPSAANDNRAELEISVPDNMVLEGGALYNIRMHVQVVTDCSQLRDVCSNEIANQASASYEGIRGGVIVPNELSYAGIDDCDFGIVGTSNFLVDTSGCSFETTQVMCGSSITLTAGAGFESYEWRDASGTLLGTTTVPSFDVTNEGTYTVNKIASAASGCINAEETIHVVGYNSEPNPLQPFADQVLTCASNGEELAEVYLCGDSGSRTINLPFDTSSATTVQWFKLDSCPTYETLEGCPNINTGCTWNEIGSGEFSRNFADAGEYRLDVLYDGRCPKSYYFNVYKATLNPTFIRQDILCGNNGSITVNDIPAGYQYSLTGPGGYNAPFQDSNIFSNLTAAGNYNLSIRVSSASAASCTYTFPPINIQEKDIDIDVITTPMQCFNDSAQIRVQVNNVPGDYTYELLQGGSVVGTEGPTANNDFTFNVTDGGAYTVRVTTPQTPQCSASERVVINEPDELVFTALKVKDITCEAGSSDGIIQLTASGGTLDTSSGNNYNFAVWTSQGTDLYANPSDIPNTAFLTPATNPYTYNVPVGSEGIYKFIVIDDNNCYTISDPVEITVESELAFTHSETDVTCNGLTDGTINVSVDGDNLGYSVEYSLDNNTWNLPNDGYFDGLAAGTYIIYIRASKNSYQCLYEIPNVVINEPAPLNGGSATKTDLECNTSGGTTFGTITYTAPTGGTPNYTYYYKLNSESTYTLAANNPVTGLPAGTYNTRAIDASGCIIDLNNVTINGLPSAPNVTSTVVYNCDGTGNVTITATPAGTYTYTLNGNSNTTGVFNNVPVGGYTAEVTYGGSCVEDIRVRVNAGNEFSGSIVGSADSECYGSDNGSITISANNVIGGSFEYSTDGGATWSMTADNPYRVVGLAAGTYNVFIREGHAGVASCVIDLGNVTIGQPEELTLAASVTQEVTCNIATGTITATATGGIPPYEYSIDGGASWHSSNVFNNVPPRATDYVVMVRDSRNCNECGCTAKLFQNGSFERPAETTTRFRFYNEDDIPGWDSTASDNQIELWHNGFNGVTAYEGNSFAELNANRVSSLYQEYCTQPGDIITWSVAHRGRSGLDRATVKIGGDLATAGVVETMETNNTAWKVYTGSYTVPVGQSTTIIAFDALSTAGGNNTVGNFIDDVQINIASTTCVPVSVPVIEPNTVDFDLKPTLCYDGSGNAEIRVEVTSGNNDYQFRIDGGIWRNPDVATPDEFTFTGLTDGTYSIEVRDGLGCTIPAKDATILPQLTATITAVSATCNDGQIVITPNGGDGNYEFIVETGGVQTSYTSSPIAVPAGTYTVYVRDKNGGANYCEYSDTVTVNQIAAPTVSSTSTQPNCSTDTGTINVTVGSGTSPYTVTVTGPGGPFVQGPSADVNYSFTGLGDGTYQITVSDANGCPPVATSTETINVPTALAGGSASKTDLMCSPTGTILGTISFTAPTGGTAPYIYYYRLVGGGAYTQIAGTTVSNLPAGDYETKVEDSNGCERILDTLTIADLPAVPAFASTVVYNCDGTGNITITPFDASYTYSLDGAAAQTGANANIFNNVAAGAHTVTVDYGSNCTEDVLVTVAADQEFTAAVINTTNPTCLGDNNGSIEVEASFPSSTPTEFEYNIGAGWVSTLGNNPFVIPNFTSGTHTIEVRPVGGIAACEQTVSATLTDPSVVTVVAPVTKEITCNPATGATITPDASGGNGPTYTYELLDSSNNSIAFTDVPAGTYTVVATDRLGCTGSVAVTVVPIETVTFTAEAQCYDGTNGEILVTVLTGNGNYSYSLNGGTTFTPVSTNPFTISGLSPGNHTIRVQDGKGCFADVSVTINPQLFATADVTNASCTNGEILINPIGGTGAGTYMFSVVADGASAGVFSTTNPVTRGAGTYDVYVRDNNGVAPYCEYLIEDVVINTITPVDITATVNEPTCNGDTGSIDVVMTPNTGEAPYTITVTDSTGVINTINNYIGTDISFNNLTGNETYIIEITDALGCTDAQTVTLTDPPAIVIDINPVLPSNCVVDPAQTGFDFININPNDYLPNTLQYSVDNGVNWVDFTVTNGQLRGYNSGDVVYPALRIVNSVGTELCQESYGPYEIPFNVSGLIVNPIIVPGNCSVGLTVTVEAIDGTRPFEFAINSPDNWQPADPLDNGTMGNPDRTRTYTGLIPGVDYEFYVRDATGCIKENNENIYENFTPSVPITSTINNQACFGANSGQITFTIDNTSGDLSPNFTWTLYERDPVTNVGAAVPAYTNVNQTGFDPIVVSGLAPGTYYVVLTNDIATCSFGAQDVVIFEGTEIQGQLTKVRDITCSVDGLVRIENVTGGFPGYTYTFNVTNGTGIISGNTITVAAGSVSATPVLVEAFVEDSNSCGPVSLGTVSLNLSQSPTISSVVPASCGANKTITINVNNGTAPYSYSVDGGINFSAPTTNTSYAAEGLADGTYDIVVRDVNGCTDTANGVIIYSDIDFDITPVSNASCIPGSDAEVEVSISSGTGGDYNYSVDGGAVNTILAPTTTATIGSLAPGAHTITVTDVTSGCVVTKSITIQAPVYPSFTATSEDSVCSGDNSGIIRLTAVDNGILPLTYTINGSSGYTYTLPAGDSVFTGLAPDTYSVIGRATNGCTFTVNNIVIDEYAPIVPSTPVVEQFGCSTGNTVDVATVTIPAGTVGGSTNYTRYVFVYMPADGSGPITQDGSSASFSTTNTSGGPVQITVYDDKGCSGVENTTIDDYVAITGVTISPQRRIDCNEGEDIEATYTINTVGALANFEFRLYDDTNALLETRTNTDGDFATLLATGTYRVELENRDTNCIYTEYHTVEAEPTFDILITNVDDVDCKVDNNGSAVLSFVPSTPPYTSGYSYIVYDATTDTATAVTGTGTAGTPETITGLVAGEYYVRIDMGTNSPFCEAQSANFTIAEPADSLSVTGVANPVVSCYNGSDATITATATGGWGDYVYQLEETSNLGTAYAGNTYSSNNIFTNLPAGDYTVVVRDKNGATGVYCESTDQVVIANPAAVTFTVTENDNSCDTTVGGSISVTATGGTGTYTYTLSNGSGVVETQILNAANYTFTNLAADAYTVNVVDSNGCVGTVTNTSNITITPDLVFTLTETKKLTCSPPMAATVALEVTSGSGSYAYEVAGPSIAVGRTNLAGTTLTLNPTVAGTYTVTVYDAGATPECSVVKTIEIQDAERPSFTATATVTDICFGSSTGEVTVSPVDNGILPLTYTISPDPNGDSGVSSITNVVFSDLPAGTYTITAQGINGCTTSVSETINANPAIDISNAIDITQFACTAGTNTTNNAIITVDKAAITGGTGNYVRVVFEDAIGTVLQDDSNFTYISTGLAGGDYTVKVYDENTDCFVSRVVTIDSFTPMTGADIKVEKNTDCNTGENITVKVVPALPNIQYTITGTGATPYTRTLNVVSDADAAVFNNVPVDDYTIEIYNAATGCTFEEYHTVQPEPTFDILVSNVQRACFGGTGSATIDFSTATPYTDVYTYEVFEVGNPTAITSGNGTGGTPETITTNLVAGEYYVVVSMTYTPFCEAQSENFIIEEPANALALTGTPTYINCNVTDSGEILLEAQGGWAPYEYQLVNDAAPATPVQNFDSNRRITGLAAGSYTATVRDVTGCEDTFTFRLQPTTNMAADVAVTQNLCEGERTATIEVTNVTGGQTQDGTVSYSYILMYPDGVTQVEQLSNTFSNLPAGTNYTVTVRDNKYSCTYTEQVDIIDPSEVEASANITADITCNNRYATVVVSAIGGTGNYEYSNDGVNFVPNNTFTNVSSGSQTFYVRDDNNCEDTVVVTVNAYEPLVPTLVVDSGFVTCNGDANGVLSATVAGGFGNYEYQLLDGSNNPIDGTWTTSNTFGGLDVGTYKIRVRSTNRFGEVCTEDTAPHSIVEPEPLVVAENHTDVSCFGGNDGTITVLASGGNLTGYEYNISTDPTNKFVTDNVFRNLTAGTYTITVKDKVGCIDTIDVVIDQPQQFTATLVGVTEQTCINNATPTIELDVQGGTQPYYVSINNIEQPTPYTTNTIVLGAAENIQAGTSYYITVRDEAGCNVADPIRVTTAEPVDLQLTVDFAYTCEVGNVIKAIVDDKYKNSTSYALYDGNGNQIGMNNEGEFFDLPAGVGYHVVATHTVTGCNESSMSTPISIEDIQPLTMTIDDSVKNTLIANADLGLPPYEYSVDGGDFGPDNEFLILQTKDYTITVRDARGCEVTLTVRGEYISILIPNLFSPDGDGDNDYWYPREVEDYHDIRVFIYDRYAREITRFKGIQQGWDGTYDGKPLPSGDYWYTIYFKELSGQEKKIMGHFTLYR